MATLILSAIYDGMIRRKYTDRWPRLKTVSIHSASSVWKVDTSLEINIAAGRPFHQLQHKDEA
jgi:hypothetical protein